MAFLKNPVEASKNLAADRLSFLILIFSILSILLQASLILVSWEKLPPQLPLFYSRAWGESILASKIFLWIFPLIATMFPLTNFLITLVWMREKQFLGRTLLIFSALIAFTTLYGCTKIISLLI